MNIHSSAGYDHAAGIVLLALAAGTMFAGLVLFGAIVLVRRIIDRRRP